MKPSPIHFTKTVALIITLGLFTQFSFADETSVSTNVRDAPNTQETSLTPENQTLFDGCMRVVSTFSFPEGIGPDVLTPHCMCVIDGGQAGPVRDNLFELANQADGEVLNPLMTPETQALIAQCIFGEAR